MKLNKVGIVGFGIFAGFFSGLFSTGGPLYVICVENSVKNVKTFILLEKAMTFLNMRDAESVLKSTFPSSFFIAGANVI